MQAISYKDYLELFSRYHQKSLNYSKLFFTLTIAVFFTIAVTFTISSNKNQESQPARAQINYFETANSSFLKANQSLGDLFASLQVAGTKIQKLDSLTESTPTPGFFVALSESQNTISKIREAKDNITFQQENLNNLTAPSIYSDLNNQLLEYLNDNQILLEDLEKRHLELKDLLIATGPNFFLPVLSNESLWQAQDIEKLQAYYTTQKQEARKSLENFAKIPSSIELRTFKDTQLTYYQLLVNVSDNILTVLKKAGAPDADKSIVIEEAYQILSQAKKENEYISAKLLQEKVKISSTQNYSTSINKLGNKKRLLESGFKNGQIETHMPVNSKQNSNLFDNLNLLDNIF